MNLIAQRNFNLKQKWVHVLKTMAPTQKLAECEDWDCTLLGLIQSGTIKHLFLDLNVLGISWQQRCRDLLSSLEHTKLILTSDEIDKNALLRCFEQGLWSYIPNSAVDKLGKPIVNLIFCGGQYFPSFLLTSNGDMGKNTEKNYILPSGEKLTKRQHEVLDYLKQGLSNKQIAGKMDISEPTVKLHIHGLFYKLGAINRTQIVLKASELGLI
ncbi:MAG: response regulator transcription factor [Alphaproteobacteria bacterium]|nr:response regulator transcription factor [Alphaproteobacteria bacterium]